MNALFWLLWVFNLFLLGLTILGSHFRAGFGAGTNINQMVIIGVIIILIGSLILKFFVKSNILGLVIVAIPLVFVIGVYLMEKRDG